MEPEMLMGPMLAVAEMPPLFALLAVMLLAVVAVSLVFLKFRQSLLVAYFLCGVVIANSGVLDMLAGPEGEHGLTSMAEFGVMLLLFTVGLELTISDLRYLGKWAFRGGTAQVTICLGAGWAVAYLCGLSHAQSLVLGGALALSSTAVSVKAFQDMELSNGSGARLAIAVSISRTCLSWWGFSSCCRCWHQPSRVRRKPKPGHGWLNSDS